MIVAAGLLTRSFSRLSSQLCHIVTFFMRFNYFAENFFYELERTANVEKFVHKATYKQLINLVEGFEYFRIPVPLQLTMRLEDLEKEVNEKKKGSRKQEERGRGVLYTPMNAMAKDPAVRNKYTR